MRALGYYTPEGHISLAHEDIKSQGLLAQIEMLLLNGEPSVHEYVS